MTSHKEYLQRNSEYLTNFENSSSDVPVVVVVLVLVLVLLVLVVLEVVVVAVVTVVTVVTVVIVVAVVAVVAAVAVVVLIFSVARLVVDGDEVVVIERVIPTGIATAAAIKPINSRAPNVDAKQLHPPQHDPPSSDLVDETQTFFSNRRNQSEEGLTGVYLYDHLRMRF